MLCYHEFTSTIGKCAWYAGVENKHGRGKWNSKLVQHQALKSDLILHGQTALDAQSTLKTLLSVWERNHSECKAEAEIADNLNSCQPVWLRWGCMNFKHRYSQVSAVLIAISGSSSGFETMLASHHQWSPEGEDGQPLAISAAFIGALAIVLSVKHSAQQEASFLANPQGRPLQWASSEKRKGMTNWGNKLIYVCFPDLVCQEGQWSLVLRDCTKKYPRNWKVKEMMDCNTCSAWRDLENSGKGSQRT